MKKVNKPLSYFAPGSLTTQTAGARIKAFLSLVKTSAISVLTVQGDTQYVDAAFIYTTLIVLQVSSDCSRALVLLLHSFTAQILWHCG